jgi:hypothetical protein
LEVCVLGLFPFDTLTMDENWPCGDKNRHQIEKKFMPRNALFSRDSWA